MVGVRGFEPPASSLCLVSAITFALAILGIGTGPPARLGPRCSGESNGHGSPDSARMIES